MAARKQSTAPAARKTPPKPKPWWDGLSDAAANELRRRGYKSREDAMLFIEMPMRFAGTSRPALEKPFDPIRMARPWMDDGMSPRIAIEIYNEVREWLGAGSIIPTKLREK